MLIHRLSELLFNTFENNVIKTEIIFLKYNSRHLSAIITLTTSKSLNQYNYFIN
jgi:hypothetical protein